mgnify:FL=1
MNPISNGHDIFICILTAVFLEAAPFLLAAAILSSLSEFYLDRDRIQRFIPRSRVAQVLTALGAGLILPTCECGVVLIVRRFLHKGVPPLMAVAYMLTAPIINPLAIVSTYLAFRGNWWMVFGRIGLAVVCASLTGLAIAALNREGILREETPARIRTPQAFASLQPDPSEAHESRLDSEGAREHDCCCSHGCTHDAAAPRWLGVLTHTAAEFMEMAKYLIVGALAAALFKTLTPQSILFRFESNPFLSIAVMMLLAVLLSVCSEADSFVAASFWSFSQPAQLAFVAIGPMVDLKLIGAYGATFRRRAAIMLIAAPVIIIFILSAVIAAVLG